jgi:uncharacterized protein YmfQ (DUF2313 family)
VTGELYERQLAALAPPGEAWPQSPTSLWRKLLRGLGEGLARVHLRALSLIEEADTRTTTELLTDWERVLDIPGPCSSLADTVQRRREVATQKLTSIGGASLDYWEGKAFDVGGFVVTITEPKPHTWQVEAPAELATYFTAGHGVAGDPLASYGVDELGCFFEHFKPAHTLVLFDFIP